MAGYGSTPTTEKQGDKKGLPVGQGIPSAYGYAHIPGYPSAVPHMPPAYPGYPAGAAYPYPQGPPPPYSVAVSQPSTVPGYPSHASFGYPYGIPVCSQPLLTHAPATVVMPGAFDAGARFDNLNRPVIPPPPPGAMPNAAQLAMLQGNPALVSQQKESFLSGASGGGYTFW